MGLFYPVSQGFIPSFKSAEIDVGGRKVVGVKRTAWDESCEGEIEYGNGPLALGETIGEYMANLEVEQLISEYVTLITRLGNGYRRVSFGMGVQLNEPGVDLITVEFRSIRIIAPAADLSGKAGSTVKWKARVFEPITINGLSMIDRFNAGSVGGFSIGGAVSATAGGLASFGAAVSANL